MAGTGGTFRYIRPKELRDLVRDKELELATVEFYPELSELLDNYLAGVTERDTALISRHLEKIKQTLEDDILESVDLLFGGSVAKHTYIDGLSDVDTLLTLKFTGTEKPTPGKILRYIEKKLKNELGPGVRVKRGSMAITIGYGKALEVQLIPAIRDDRKLRVPSWNGKEWSKIDPKAFSAALTKRNQECGGKLIPTIKLAKSINASLPNLHRLTGYHLESLGVAAFRNYDGPKVTSRMINHFFDEIPNLLRKPIRDVTGQSINVDQYLGPSNSVERKLRSEAFSRIRKRMGNATARGSAEEWKAIIGD